MKIRTKLLLSAATSIGLVIVLGVVVFFSDRQVDEAIAKNQTASRIRERVSELNVLAAEYQENGGERTRTQWYLVRDDLAVLLAPDEFASMMENLETLETTFAQLVASREAQQVNGFEPSATHTPVEDRLVAQLSLRSQSITSEAVRLADATRADIAGLEERTTVLTLTFVGALLAIVIGTGVAVSLSIGNPIKRLTRAAEDMAKGNLNTRAESIGGKDEIGILGGAFNLMAARLKETIDSLEERVAERTVAAEELRLEITERKQAEEALKESEEKFRSMAETSPLSIYMSTGIEQTAHYINPRFVQLFGYTIEDVPTVGHWWPRAYPDEKYRQQIIDEWQDKVKRAIETKTPIEPMDVTVTCKDGSTKNVMWGFTSLGDTNFAFGLDITERKQAEEALRESERQVRRKLDAILSPEADIGALELADIIDSEKIQKLMNELYEVTHMGIGIIDLHGRVLVGTGWQEICTKFHRINPETCRLCIESDLELSRDVPVGTFKRYRCKNNMWDIATPIKVGDLHLGNIFLGQFLFDDETVDYETFRQQALRYGFDEQEYIAALDRSSRWSRKTVDAMMSFDASFAEIVGNLSYANVKLAGALEDRKRAEQQLKKFNKTLEQRVTERTAAAEERAQELARSNGELDDFTYVVSHDLKEPLRGIEAFSTFLAEDYADKLDEQGHKYVGVLRDSATRMNALIEDLLVLSRIGRTREEFATVSVESLLQDVRCNLAFALEDKKADLRIQPDLPTITCQPPHLKQVFDNLISNAIKFNDKPQPVVEIACHEDDGTYIFSVRDNGIGIDERYYEKIFQIFQRLGRREDYEGTGAGLTICKKIVEARGGKIWLESKVGQGSTFLFTIPKEVPRPQRAKEA